MKQVQKGWETKGRTDKRSTQYIKSAGLMSLCDGSTLRHASLGHTFWLILLVDLMSPSSSGSTLCWVDLLSGQCFVSQPPKKLATNERTSLFYRSVSDTETEILNAWTAGLRQWGDRRPAVVPVAPSGHRWTCRGLEVEGQAGHHRVHAASRR